MIKKKELKKQIETLTKQVEELKNVVVTEELKRLRVIEEQYQEQNKLISNVKFNVKTAKISEDGEQIVIIYHLPIVRISLNEKGEPIDKNPFFYSVNALGMVGVQDYELLNRVFENAKKIAKDKIN